MCHMTQYVVLHAQCAKIQTNGFCIRLFVDNLFLLSFELIFIECYFFTQYCY